MHKYAALAVIILFCIPGYAYGEQPIDVIRKSIDQAIGILKDPRYNDADQKKLVQLYSVLFWQYASSVTGSRLTLLAPTISASFSAASIFVSFSLAPGENYLLGHPVRGW